MYLKFESVKDKKLGSFNDSHVYLDDIKAGEAFLRSLSCGDPFLMENGMFVINSAKRLEPSNGLIEFTANANFYDGSVDEVSGTISFYV